MNELQRFFEYMKNLGYLVNARNQFYAFMEAIDSDEKLIKECQNIYCLLNEIVLDKEKDQFFIELEKGKELFRARIIDIEETIILILEWAKQKTGYSLVIMKQIPESRLLE